jgi:hypothetical protein
MTQQIGGAIGLAVVTAVATSHVHGIAVSGSSLTSGFRSALLVSAGIAAAAIVAAVAALPRVTRQRTNTVAAVPAT